MTMPVRQQSLQVKPASTYLNDLNATIYIRLSEILDLGGTWRRLIGVLPDDFYSAEDVAKFEQTSLRVGQCGPSSTLLMDMGNRGVTVGELILYLERLQLERALVLIKEFNPVQFIRQLPTRETRQAGPGTNLRLECYAAGFPRPSYQWFKFSKPDNDWIEIDGQQQSALDIRPLSIEDAGLYCCRASNENPHNDQESSCAFTNPCHIEINLVVRVIEKELHVASPCKGCPIIKEEPTCPNNRPLFMGSLITFRCRAEGETPLRYQWFQNRKPIEGANECTFVLNNLQPVNDEVKFEIQCAVTNPSGMTLSKVAAFTLAAPRENIQFSAEDKVALLIGNEAYQEHLPLNCPTTDVSTLAELLRSMNYKVFCLINLTREEMHVIVDRFCEFLRDGVYGLFYFAGHCFQLYRQNYMIPVDAKKECSLQDCLCLEDVEERMQRHDLSLCCIILDACRREQRHCADEQLVTYRPKSSRNTVRVYSTSQFSGALDGNSGGNGVFMKHLRKYIRATKPLHEVLLMTKAAFSVDDWVHNIQFPEITSTLAKSLSLCDQVDPKSLVSTEMDREYKILTEPCLPPTEMDVNVKEDVVTVLIDFPLCQFHNKLVILLSARTTTPCKKTYVPVVESFEPEDVKWDRDYNRNSNCLTVSVFDLQKIKEPLAMNVILWCDGQAVKLWRMDILNPPIAEAQFWERQEKQSPTDMPEESGFVSDLTEYTLN